MNVTVALQYKEDNRHRKRLKRMDTRDRKAIV